MTFPTGKNRTNQVIRKINTLISLSRPWLTSKNYKLKCSKGYLLQMTKWKKIGRHQPFLGYITSIAATNTRFFKIYCVSKVGWIGPLKQSSGKKAKGVNVRTIWVKPKMTANRGNFLVRKSTATKTSQIARRINESLAGKRPLVKMEMVLTARSSAGLAPGMNFNTPNIK